jgi:hypothetical protein
MSVRDVRLPTFRMAVPSYTWFVAALVLVWGVGDAASTLFALQVTGSVQLEANPLVRMLLTENPLWLPVLKTGVVAIAGGVLLRFRAYIETVPGWRLWFVSILALGSTIVVTNLYVGVVTIA